MAWFRVRLTEEEQRVVNEERCCHPNLRIREKMLVLWLLHTGLTRQHAAKAVGVSRATVQRYVAAFRQGGLDGLRQWNLSRPVSEMAAYRELIRASFEKQPATTIAEACERIFQLTGLRRGPSQVRKFLKDLGLKFYRVRAIPVPPKKTLAEHVADQAAFLETKLKPVLAAAQAGEGHVFFVDAAHFVFGTFLCYLWSFTRIFVRAASGRQRFNVLGAWNAVTRHLIAVTNTTVVNTETMSELLRKIAALGLTGAITLVLDNARYQHNAAVKALASQLGITLLFLPSYSPNLNLIERLWKFTKRRALYGRYHPKFANFQAAIQEILDGIPTTYAQQLETLMTLNFQQFEDVSLPNLRIREKMLVLWLLHTGLTRQHAAKAVGAQSGHRPAIRGRVSAGGLGRLAAVESQSPGERDGRLSRVDPPLLREATSHDRRRRGVRTHLSTDRVLQRSAPSAASSSRIWA